MQSHEFPSIYEINTRVWLKELESHYHHPISIGTVPIDEWERLQALGFSYIWLMGIWQPSNVSRQIALTSQDLQLAYSALDTNWQPDNIVSSPYAVTDYTFNSQLGNLEELDKVKTFLHGHGIRLLLDFVPNHTAIDHPWVINHPAYYVQAKQGADPQSYFSTVVAHADSFIAYGRDPNYPAWTDTAQLNYFNPETRQVMIQVLLFIAKHCDGVRCDMAMLLLNDIFQKTWERDLNQFGWQKPPTEFWQEAITTVKAQYPNFIFIAESYWQTEEQLQNLGFDFTYDKTLYDKLVYDSAQSIRDYLRRQRNPDKWLRFIENHDEKRAASIFGKPKSMAAAACITTLPGATLIHQGQMEGRSKQLPVQYGVVANEPPDFNLQKGYKRLLPLTANIRKTDWQLLEANVFDTDNSPILAWQWSINNQTAIVVINYSPNFTKANIALPLPTINQSRITFTEKLSGKSYTYESQNIQTHGLYVELEPWQYQIFIFDTNQ